MQEGKSAGLGAIAGAADTYWGKNKGRSHGRHACEDHKNPRGCIYRACSCIESGNFLRDFEKTVADVRQSFLNQEKQWKKKC